MFDPVSLGIMGGGALAGGLSSLFKKSPKQQQVPRLDPRQLGLQQQAGQMAMQGLQNPYAGFDPIEQHARSQFHQSTIPSISERFTAMPGGQRSSAFQGALGQASAGLESSLGALRSQYGLQSRGLSQNLLGQALTPNFDTVFQQHQPGFLESALGGLSGSLGQYGAQGLSGMFGPSGNQFGQGQGSDVGMLIQKLMQLLQQRGMA